MYPLLIYIDRRLTKTDGIALHVKDEHLAHRHAFDDLTDQENPDFRYTY